MIINKEDESNKNMKLQIIPAIKQGLEVIIKNPIILVPIVINAILGCIVIYFFTYTPKLTYILEMIGVAPENPAYFILYTILFTIIFYIVLLFLNLIICKMVFDVVKSNVSVSEAISLSARKFIFIFIAAIPYSLVSSLISYLIFYLISFITITIPYYHHLGYLIEYLITILLTIIGLIALIILGIFLLIKFVFYSYAILLDNEKIINSFKKSWQITKKDWWRIVGLYLIFLIPITALSGIASTIAMDAVQTALVLNFVMLLLAGWAISAFTIVYIQLTNNIE